MLPLEFFTYISYSPYKIRFPQQLILSDMCHAIRITMLIRLRHV